MEVSKFLRTLADLIDSAQQAPQENVSNGAEVHSDETVTMVPPLQQELELMKKMADVESIYDETCKCGQNPCTCEKEEPEVGDPSANVESDELTVIKKNAGLGLGLTDGQKDL